MPNGLRVRQQVLVDERSVRYLDGSQSEKSQESLDSISVGSLRKNFYLINQCNTGTAAPLKK